MSKIQSWSESLKIKKKKGYHDSFIKKHDANAIILLVLFHYFIV